MYLLDHHITTHRYTETEAYASNKARGGCKRREEMLKKLHCCEKQIEKKNQKKITVRTTQ